VKAGHGKAYGRCRQIEKKKKLKKLPMSSRSCRPKKVPVIYLTNPMRGVPVRTLFTNCETENQGHTGKNPACPLEIWKRGTGLRATNPATQGRPAFQTYTSVRMSGPPTSPSSRPQMHKSITKPRAGAFTYTQMLRIVERKILSQYGKKGLTELLGVFGQSLITYWKMIAEGQGGGHVSTKWRVLPSRRHDGAKREKKKFRKCD